MADQKGFTLAEIIVTLAIVSVMSVISIPPLKAWCQGAGFRSEVSQLVGCLQSAKMEAVKTNAHVVIEVNENGYSAFVDNSPLPGEASDWERQENEHQLFSCQLKNGVTLASNFPQNKFRFNASPGVKAGRFILTDASGNRTDVIVNTVGRIRVQ